jgi:hypothetical protein
MSRKLRSNEETSSCLAGNASLATTLTLTRVYAETYQSISQIFQGVSAVGQSCTIVQDSSGAAATLAGS